MRIQTLALLLITLLSVAQVGIAQNSYRTYVVKDQVTKEPISDCIVSYNHNDEIKYVTSSSTGTFTISEEKKVTLNFSHVSYEDFQINESELKGDAIFLKLKKDQLDEVTIYSAYSLSNKGSSYTYNSLQAEASISVIGEPDILRHISSLPSVSQGIESTLGLFVRGGNNGSNGIYFNDVPMYVTSHLMGMFSVFPADITNNATFYMGGLPASKGNQSSSLLDVSIKRNYGSKFSGKYTLSPYLSGIYSSVPIVKDKLSIQFSGRTSFVPFIINMFNDETSQLHLQIFDVTANIDYRLSDRNFVDAMFFTTNDYIDYSQEGSVFAQNWRASIGKIGWRSLITDRLSLNVRAYYNNTYSAQKDIKYYNATVKRESELGLSSGLKEWSVNSEMNYVFNNKFNVNYGISAQKQEFNPGNEKYVVDYAAINNSDKRKNDLLSLFAEASFDVNKYLSLHLGYRQTFQKTETTDDTNFDVHFLSHIFLNDNWGIELTFDRFNQYYHVLEGLPTGWSMNIMTPSTERFPSELSNQYYSGLFWKKSIKEMKLNFSFGGYYREMRNIVTYINAVNAFGFDDKSWEEEVDLGNGSSYGLELSGSVQGKRFGSTLAYTLSKTDRKYPNLNHGEAFPFKFDRRHIFNLQTKFTLSKYRNKRGKNIEHVVNSVLAYSSGNRATLPLGSYQGIMPPYWNQSTGQIFPDEFHNNIYDRQIMSSRNGYVMKDYFRIDLAYTLKRIGKKTTNELSLSIFNVLNRHNPYMYFHENDEWQQLSIVPIMPSVRWSIAW